MVHGRDDPMPLEAVRDLLGIVRALFSAWQLEKANPIALEELRAIGVELAAVLKFAKQCAPGTLGHVAAWQRAERATESLGKLVSESSSLQPTLAAGIARALTPRATPAEPSERPSREETRKIRRLRS